MFRVCVLEAQKLFQTWAIASAIYSRYVGPYCAPVVNIAIRGIVVGLFEPTSSRLGEIRRSYRGLASLRSPNGAPAGHLRYVAMANSTHKRTSPIAARYSTAPHIATPPRRDVRRRSAQTNDAARWPSGSRDAKSTGPHIARIRKSGQMSTPSARHVPLNPPPHGGPPLPPFVIRKRRIVRWRRFRYSPRTQ